MSRDEWIKKHQHELCGLIFEALVNRPEGSQLSLFMKMIFVKVNDRMGQMYEDLKPLLQTPRKP